MKTWLKTLIIIAAVGIIAAIIATIFVNKPHKDYAKIKADVELTASDLFTKYTENKPESDKTMTGKVIQIKGNLTKIEQNDSSAIVVFVFRQGEFGDEGIRCIMIPEEKAAAVALKPNQEVVLKGYCTGYNEADVILNKCVLVTQ